MDFARFCPIFIAICFISHVISTTSVLSPGPETLPGSALVQARGLRRVRVHLPSGARITGRSFLGVESFNAIPFAEPPVGPLRLKPPERFSGPLGKFDGTRVAPACPQMFLSREGMGDIGRIVNDFLQNPFFKTVAGQEDCLTVNVQRPAGTEANAKLPVLFWIYGGGFELGFTAMYDATGLLRTAMEQKQPFIFVAVNYRVAGFGFMPGKEILADGSANLGLLDQRMGLEWVADNIAAFGGDPTKVTIWGQSAGAISVFDQMALYDGNATYKGKPLFRGAIMNSGSTVSADPVDCPKGQAVYNKVVQRAGCFGEPDTLECLRQTDYKTFLNAVNSVPGIVSYQSLALSYLPRPDGKVLTDSPHKLAESGRYHAVPMIIGNQEDEGTIFALWTQNVTTVDKFVDYLSKFYFHSAPKQRLKELVRLYEPAIERGSPFRTGAFSELYPGFKRIAAVLGDLSFTMARRVVLSITTTVHPEIPTWSYMASYNHGSTVIGTFHASDLLQVFYGILPNHAMKSCRTYYFNFLYHLDPNKGVRRFAKWPKWQESKKLMWFRWGHANDIMKDDFRSDVAAFVSKYSDVLRI